MLATTIKDGAIWALRVAVMFIVAHRFIAEAAECTKVVGSGFRHEETGCHSSAKPIEVTVPNAKNLTSKDFGHGAPAGIEFKGIHLNHGQIQNIRWKSAGKLAFDLSASGSGTWIQSPIGGGGVCSGAEGASAEVQKVLAHYKDCGS
jgi:hypothetical protein